MRSHACSGPLPSNVSGAAANGTNFFPALRAMNISHNAFSGTLPAAFGQSGVFNLKPLQVCPAPPVCNSLRLPLCPCLSRYPKVAAYVNDYKWHGHRQVFGPALHSQAQCRRMLI